LSADSGYCGCEEQPGGTHSGQETLLHNSPSHP
jgi:hypothetical protein